MDTPTHTTDAIIIGAFGRMLSFKQFDTGAVLIGGGCRVGLNRNTTEPI